MPISSQPINFAAQSKEYAAKQINSQVCKNWYSIMDDDAKFKQPLLPFPGSLLWSDDASANKSVRGMYSLNGTFYAVVDDEFRIYNDHGEWNKIGTLSTSMGFVRFMANDNQIFVTDFQNGYVYQLVTTISRKQGDFFKITNASSFIGKAQFVGSGVNDMSADGTYTGSNDKTYKVEIDGQATSSISAAVFVGSGLNDMVTGGKYTGLSNKKFRVQIDTVAAVNTIRWSEDEGTTWVATGVPITAAAMPLKEGITVQFNVLTGHTLNDYWNFTATAAGLIDTFRWSSDDGSTWIGSNIEITGGDQLLDDGVSVIFVHTSGHTKSDVWTVQVSIDSAFYPPIIPIYLDSYGIFPKSNTQRFYLSSSEDFSAINALDYASTNAFPDNVVCGVARNSEIVFIGTVTTEIWYDTGLSPFPLQRRGNLLIGWGTNAPYSMATASNNAIFWLAQNINGGRVVVGMLNYDVAIISNKALNDKLQSYTNIEEAFGYVIEWAGKIFYFLTIPSADVTWVYDFDAKAWRQRTTWRVSEDVEKQDFKEGRYLANCHVYHNSEHYIGDWKSGKIYKMSDTYYKDGSFPIIHEAITAPLLVNLDRMGVYALHVDFEAATGLTTGQGSESTVMFQYSKDGGYTWSKETTRSIGKVGEYTHRCKWNKIGYGRSMVFRIRVSDPVYKVILGAMLTYEDTGS